MARPWRKRALDWLTLNVGVPLIYLFVRLLSLTVRWRAVGDVEFYKRTRGSGAVVAFWHGDSYYLSQEMRKALRQGAMRIMASQSRDGALMARFLRLSGSKVVRGSSSHGGGRALIELIRAMLPGDYAALAVDAPRGPRHCINRPGVLMLAQRSGRTVVPIAGRAERMWAFRSWDRTELPRPFTTVTLYYGTPVTVPPDADDAELERLRVAVEADLRELKGEK
jgi:lysophospholipid acyltransferase (LPLAT)-like uncharacterized protein